MKLNRQIKNFIQRGKKGWCPEDTWNLDNYLSRVIAESVDYLNKNKHGYPHRLTDKKWSKILKDISEGMLAVERFDDNFDYDQSFEKYKSEYDKAYKKRKEALKLLTTYFNNLWD